MIVTRSWLQEWIDISKITSQDIIDKLNSIGFEIAEYSTINIPSKVVVGKVLDCKKHKNANKLMVCQVDTGTEIKQIVCGAKNVAKDMFVPVALVGAILPNGLKIEATNIRGVDSYGMICSFDEIGLPKLEDGIMILDNSIGELKLGKEISEYKVLNDEIIDIELTANRGDCLSILGIARELSAAFDIPIKNLKDIVFDKAEKMQVGIGRLLHIKHKDIEADLIYKLFSNKDYQNPLKVKIRLSFIKEELKNEIENLAFYTTYSVGTVMRVYSYEKFRKDESAIINLRKDENLMDAVYADEKLSIIGVNQKDESKPKDIDKYFIAEASFIDPQRLAKSYYQASKKEKIDTDWVYYRSSRGSNPDLNIGIDYFCTLIGIYSDLDIFSGAHKILQEKEPKNIKVNLETISNLIGEEITNSKLATILTKLEFDLIKSEDKSLVIKVPPFRHDIENEQDIAEECIRFIGIDNINSKPFKVEEKSRINLAMIEYEKKKELRVKANASGFYETVSYIFTDKKKLKRYGLKTIKDKLELINPITKELNTLRTSLVPSLLDQTINNIKNGKKSVKLFEIGTIFNENRDEKISFALIFSGAKEEDSVLNHGKPKEIDFATFVNKISSIIGDFELEDCGIKNSLLHPFCSASIIKNGNKIGVVYKLHNRFQKELELPATFICELDFKKIPYGIKEAKEYSKYQSSLRDLSILIDKDIKFDKIRKILKDYLPKEVKRFYPVDIFKSSKLGDKVSLTIRFMIQSDDKTLSEEEISKILDQILSILDAKIGAKLR